MRGLKLRYTLPLLFLPFALLFSSISLAQPDGAALFSQNCKSCHSIGKGIVVGPDLKDVDKRRPEDWLVKWIQSSATMIKAGDPYGVALFNKFNQSSMPDQALSDEEVKAVLTYIGQVSVAPAATAGGDRGGHGTAESQQAAETGVSATMWILIISLLLGVIWVLGSIKDRLAKALRQRQGLPEPVRTPGFAFYYNWARKNKKLVAVMLILLVVIGSVKGWYALASIGVSEGYQPKQPIEFSHKIHAGDMNMACIYCHSGAEKGKTASVPSANVCMNCHKFIKEGPETGTEEIAKIYKALDYDPATQVYGKNQKPIEWVRVHNLPDLAYFNHSQHVKVGGLECETCHGNMKEVTVAKQHAPLTMGWCVDCHINTSVKTEGNEYYDNYTPVHFNKHDTHDSTLTVEKIGGTECARCHY